MLDSTFNNQVYNFYRQLYFEEEGKLKHSFNFNVQYYISQKIGIQLEFNQQKASYFSHLKWYGAWVPAVGYPNNERYLEINHIEEPYRKAWSINSLTLSLLFVNKRHPNQKIYPHFSAGIGLYFLRGDRDLVLNRWRLGPTASRLTVKIGGGLKCRLGSKIGLNLRIFGETITRKYLSRAIKDFLYVGSEQFHLKAYLELNKIIRTHRVFVKNLTYFGIDLSLEFYL